MIEPGAGGTGRRCRWVARFASATTAKGCWRRLRPKMTAGGRSSSCVVRRVFVCFMFGVCQPATSSIVLALHDDMVYGRIGIVQPHLPGTGYTRKVGGFAVDQLI